MAAIQHMPVDPKAGGDGGEPALHPRTMYIAGKFADGPAMGPAVAEALGKAWGATVPCPWWTIEQRKGVKTDAEALAVGTAENKGVLDADLVVAFITDREYKYSGTRVELGVALGAKLLRARLGLPATRVLIVKEEGMCRENTPALRVPHLEQVDAWLTIPPGSPWVAAVPTLLAWVRATRAFAPAGPRVISLESPYSESNGHPLAVNIAYTVAAIKDAEARGDAPYASHALHTQTLVAGGGGTSYISDHVPDAFGSSRDACIRLTHAVRRRCDAVVLYTDLGESSGMRAAVDLAQVHGIPVERRTLAPHLMAEVEATEARLVGAARKRPRSTSVLEAEEVVVGTA